MGWPPDPGRDDRPPKEGARSSGGGGKVPGWARGILVTLLILAIVGLVFLGICAVSLSNL